VHNIRTRFKQVSALKMARDDKTVYATSIECTCSIGVQYYAVLIGTLQYIIHHSYYRSSQITIAENGVLDRRRYDPFRVAKNTLFDFFFIVPAAYNVCDIIIFFFIFLSAKLFLAAAVAAVDRSTAGIYYVRLNIVTLRHSQVSLV